ncbi:MAG: phosphoribosylanthranilate isomerase [Candidatus Eisenbacteria bacterium]|uniref:N-(5'-phosphoribosyl)anthranilate isomerase n=1 Tax=Eiseniibacteriota bacterium TaxID=2212470 RepID=A0A538U0X7_UNCEI|nr:MAG: phosphoribosylanthranilate isomerase [Candidatus Eisenbacteria bacterium]
MERSSPHHTVVKVCGVTRLEDARAALEAGADWLGFVLWPRSPRAIEPPRAAEIVAATGGAVAVAVMVSPTPDEAAELAGRIGAARVQLHQVDPLAWPVDFPFPVTFAIPVAEDGALERALPRAGPLVMLDAADEVRVGGTGRRIPWETARVVSATRDVLLAGGLDGDSVREALERVSPFGVDASSGLESAPGRKDPDKVRRFVAAVREFDGER